MKNTSQVVGKHGAALEGRAWPLLRAADERGFPTAPFPADTCSGSPTERPFGTSSLRGRTSAKDPFRQ